MTQKKELKIDKAELQNLTYPIMFGIVIVISLIVFGLSLRFIFKSISQVLFINNQTGSATVRFQDENVKALKRYLPDN
ncbi:MAG: hypothetical protein UU22_C0004G0007 [Parcubacteria group bacterium GW2011_GWA2_40_8]|uniref:Uncharacterized protein n=1 Tax=Candidatus Terrybacteria bacterium RIFCSPLOWO2_01_FULL_40_23 TaxID=1802366 RepID=A0A1G2PX91_9BACT|nr:MAG: hypothetical protein UU22_C0004G0007 [Parcubacteria group bacterium GW2011_GWA2_40_8]OHA52958.1 MAG: hypothetical protein A3A97_04100 [Candidatus Terrybacteria bacterium RIFCSPLOWO2_01_FULL_40_23]